MTLELSEEEEEEDEEERRRRRRRESSDIEQFCAHETHAMRGQH